MLASRLYSPTLREIPADAVVVSHQYMLKAGMMRKISNGLYAFYLWHGDLSVRLKISSAKKWQR